MAYDKETTRKLIKRELQNVTQSIEFITKTARESGLSFVFDTLWLDGATTLRFTGDHWEIFDDSTWRESGCTIGYEDDMVSSWTSSSDYC